MEISTTGAEFFYFCACTVRHTSFLVSHTLHFFKEEEFLKVCAKLNDAQEILQSQNATLLKPAPNTASSYLIRIFSSWANPFYFVQ